MSYLDVLKQTKVSGLLCTNGKITTIFSERTIEDCLWKLKKHKFLSLPVLDSKTVNFLGFVDTLDVATYVVAKMNSDWPFEKIIQHPIGHVLNYSKRDPTCTLPNSSNLNDVLQLLSKAIHRVAIVDMTEPGLLLNVITQLALLQFIVKHTNKIPQQLLQTKVRDLALHHKVISISGSETALEALRSIKSQDVTSAAITVEGKLVACLSCADLRGLTYSSFEAMKSLCTIDFLKSLHSHDITPAIATPETTFETLLLKFAAGLHRIFVVKDIESMKPEGAISLTDVLRCLL